MIHTLAQGKHINRDTSHSLLSRMRRFPFVICEQLFYLISGQTGGTLVPMTVSLLSHPGRFARASAPPWPACCPHTA